MDEHQLILRWKVDGWIDGCVVSTSSPTWHNGVPNAVPLHVPMWRPSGKGTWWVMGPLPRLPSQALPLFSFNTLHFSNFAYSNWGKTIFLLCVPRIWILSGLLTSSTGANMTRTREEYVQFPCILARNILYFGLGCFSPFLKVEGSLRYLCFKSRATFPSSHLCPFPTRL
jgi:hypothetical protein